MTPTPVNAQKYCRICWNTEGWKRPTGEAAKLEAGSYVAGQGAGHEEWLLDFSWPLSGYNGDTESYHYGHLQPIGKNRDSRIGQSFDICLYTVSPTKEKWFVGIIRNVYVPDNDEAEWAYRQFKKNGRVAVLKAQLALVNAKTVDVTTLRTPGSFSNVRFQAKDVELFSPWRQVPANHVVARTSRYQLLNWAGQIPAPTGQIAAVLPDADADADADSPERLEAMRVRAAMAGTEYSPEHVKLQNALYRWLVKQHGKDAVDYEKNYVDLVLTINGETTFFEIKTADSAKSCIRQALGQLLEYCHYAGETRADCLVVVGDAPPLASDRDYLQNLRTRYQLPISYRQWLWESQSLAAAATGDTTAAA